MSLLLTSFIVLLALILLGLLIGQWESLIATIPLSILIWVEIAIFVLLDIFTLAIVNWLFAPYWVIWVVSFLFIFGPFALFVFVFAFGIITALWD